jgi:hypothetical protein
MTRSSNISEKKEKIRIVEIHPIPEETLKSEHPVIVYQIPEQHETSKEYKEKIRTLIRVITVFSIVLIFFGSIFIYEIQALYLKLEMIEAIEHTIISNHTIPTQETGQAEVAETIKTPQYIFQKITKILRECQTSLRSIKIY